MKKVFIVTAVLALLGLSIAAQAAITIETVAVGNAGNVGELSGDGVAGGYGPNRICGSVGYNYNIGKYEVTAGQYTAFLNAVAKTDTYGLTTPAWTRRSAPTAAISSAPAHPATTPTVLHPIGRTAR